MNRIVQSVAILGLIFSAGCDELLEESPVSSVTPTNFYQTAADALTAVNGAYQILHSNAYTTGRNYTFMIETPTPQIVSYSGPTNVRGQFDVYQISPSNGYLLSSWEAIYQGINIANSVIDNVPGIKDMNPALRARIVAEAKWLRALHYFNAVRIWGGVPLRTSETNDLDDLEAPRATADEIYNFIIKDLTEIQKDLPVSYPVSDFGRVTRGAAQTLLAKVYLQRGVAGKSNPLGDPLYWPTAQAGDLQKAEAELRKVIASGVYGLVPQYGMLWNEETEINEEVVFSVRNIVLGGQEMNVSRYLAPRNSGWIRTWTSAGVELPFWQSYAEGDVRRDVTWLPEYTEVSGKRRVYNPNKIWARWPTPSLRKYLIERTDVTHNPRDLVLLRYADVLLMLAEVLVEQGNNAEALGLVNQVRARAGVAPLASVDREAIYWERNWELASEQHAWYDGQRFWDIFVADLESHADLKDQLPRNWVPKVDFQVEQPKYRLMPIPQEVLDRNAQLVQNPGY